MQKGKNQHQEEDHHKPYPGAGRGNDKTMQMVYITLRRQIFKGDAAQHPRPPCGGRKDPGKGTAVSNTAKRSQGNDNRRCQQIKDAICFECDS